MSINGSQNTETNVISDTDGIGMSFIVIIVILIITIITIIALVFMGLVKYKRKSPKVKKSSKSSIKIMSKSTIADLPSSEIKSIVIESEELKLVKNEVFTWKSIIPKHNNKTKLKSPLTKLS